MVARKKGQLLFIVAISTFISLNDNCSIQIVGRKQLVSVIILSSGSFQQLTSTSQRDKR